MQEKNIKAVILVGGYGTRMRPFTFTTPKPLLPFVDEPILKKQITALSASGIRNIILAMNYKPECFEKEVLNYEKELNVKITLSIEKKSLNTGGPIGLIKSELKDSLFFVLNADIICNYPFIDMLNYHLKHKKLCTILTTKVTNPERFGVLELNEGRITNFHEKPKTYIGNDINAGIYIFSPEALCYFEPKNMSVEKEVFPRLSRDNLLMGYKLKGYWKDIGKPIDYLEAQKMFLDEVRKSHNQISPNNCNDEMLINKYVAGRNTVLGKNCIISNSTIMNNVKIGDNVVIKDCIIGNDCDIQNNVIIEDLSLIGDGVTIQSDVHIKNTIICPYKSITQNFSGDIII